MSTLQVTACDGCTEMAPHDYNPGFPRYGWIHVKAEGIENTWDVCSWECLATIVAATIAEDVST